MESMDHQERLQAFLDGELSEQEQQELDRLFEEEPELREAYEELAAQNEWTLHRLSAWTPESTPALEVGDIYARYAREQQAGSRGGLSFQWPRWAMAAAFCGLLVWLSLPGLKPRPALAPPDASTPTLQPKGQQIQMVHARRKADGSFQATQTTRNGAALHPGDLIQFLYTFKLKYYVMIVGLNAKGKVFSLMPSEGSKSVALTSGKGTVPSQGSFILDKYVGMESYVVVYSPKPFSLQSLRGALKKSLKRSKGDLSKIGLSSQRQWFYKSFWIRKLSPQGRQKE